MQPGPAYSTLCELAERKGFRILLSIDRGAPPLCWSRLRGLALADGHGERLASVRVRGSLEQAAMDLAKHLGSRVV